MKEEWRMCKGFEPFYMVSNLGRVKSVAIYSDKYQKILNRPVEKTKNIETTRDGYKRVTISYYGKQYHCAVHRLVAQAFIDNPNNYPCINHKDENPANNIVTNLEWCTYKYNSNYGTLPRRISKWQTNSPYHSKRVYQYGLDGTFITSYPSVNEASRVTGKVTGDMIGRVCRGIAKTAGGFKWSYKQNAF